MAVLQTKEQQSYIYYTPPSKPQTPKKPKKPIPIIQVGAGVSGTSSTLLLDYNDPVLNQWLAEKWMDWTINDYDIPSGEFAGEVASKDFAFIMGAWEWINDNIDYDTSSLDLNWEDRKASDILERGFGVCTDFNVLLVTTLRSAGINAKIIEGTAGRSMEEALRDGEYHVWTQVKIGNVWYDVDPLLNPDGNFVLDSYRVHFEENYIPAVLGSDSNTNDPFYADDVKQFFEDVV